MDHSTVYTALLDLLPPAKLPGEWAGLSADANARAGVVGGKLLLAKLERQFSRKRLIETGVLRRITTLAMGCIPIS